MTAGLIIFDVDGTLVDSQHLIYAAMARAFTGAGMPVPDRTAVLSVVGLSLPEAMLRLALEAEERTISDLCKAYRSAFGDLRETQPQEALYPGAREAIEALSADGFLLGIATGKSQRGVRHLLDAHGLYRLFSTIQTADDAPSKPHPAMIQQALTETGVAPERTVMVGDTSFDMAMARNAGVTGYGVAWGYHRPEALLAAGACGVALDFVGLLGELARLRPAAEAAP